MLILYVTLLYNFRGIFCQSGDTAVVPVDLGLQANEIVNHPPFPNGQNDEQEQNICGEIPGCLDDVTNGLEMPEQISLILNNMPNLYILIVLCVLTQIATFITLIKVMFCSAKKVRYHIGKRKAGIVQDEETQLKPNETYI